MKNMIINYTSINIKQKSLSLNLKFCYYNNITFINNNKGYFHSKINKKFSDEIKNPLDILEKSFEKLKRSNIRPPERSTLLIYRDCVKLCKKFYWNNDKGKPWSTILLRTVRKDFESNRDIDDSVEIGKKQVQARQGLIDLENKLAKVSFDINKFLHDTRTKKS